MTQMSRTIDLSSLKQYVPAIEIRISNPGIYLLAPLGADGKSYLCSLLHKLRDRERVDSHTYPAEFKPAELFDSEKRDLVMLDRYDMYAGQGTEELRRFAQSGIVLIASKGFYNYQYSCMSTSMHLYRDRIVVFGG